MLEAVESPHHFTTGASATHTRPMMKRANISASSRLVVASAPLNSFQTNTPQMVPTIVEPWPSAYDAAGPTILAYDATKLEIVPTPQNMPPKMPQRCHAPVPRK